MFKRKSFGFRRRFRKRFNKKNQRFSIYKYINKPSDLKRRLMSHERQLQSLQSKTKKRALIKSTEGILFSSTSIPTTGLIQNLCLCGQGTNSGQRTGRGIYLKNIQVNFRAEKNASATETHIRFMIIRMTGVLTDELNDLPTVSAGEHRVLTGNTISALTDRSNQKIYKILCDRDIVLGNKVNDIVNFKWFRRFNHSVIWDEESTSATDWAERGFIFLLVLSNESTNTPTATLNYRMKFFDK